ncbi:MAG: MBL fold metallo-hydrolase [Chitinophagales bacterium]|nr:MBL fold metallo-hydrolase [Chitinophagales bacterium]MDW8392962.1 MBL fold metallo-hydrolase [Chitinophagales bacterium]
MNLYPVLAGYFKLDGGAMFGVVPKTIWNALNPADERNLCTWALRCLLVEQGNKRVLIDCGLGNKQEEKFFRHYEPHGGSLQESLQRLGIGPADITDVVLTHLHFDHCGGAVERINDTLLPAFPQATYHIHRSQWVWALQPNAREKASFLKENFLPLEASGRLNLVDDQGTICEGFSYQTVYGHTEAMVLPVLQWKGRTVVYMADLIPSAAHVPLPYVMAYDIRPLVTLQEKQELLEQAASEQFILFFEHDPQTEACTVRRTDKGFAVDQRFRLSDLAS